MELPDLKGLSRLAGAVAVVTGGSGGIGLHTAAGLSRLGAAVLVTGRDPARGQAAVQRLIAAGGNPEIWFLRADLSTLDGVRSLAGQVASAVPRVDLLINNAGALPVTAAWTTDGFEVGLAVNHLAPFLLTHLLQPIMPSGRVVTVTSGVVRFTRLDLGRVSRAGSAAAAGGTGMRSYAQSKAAALVATLEWADRLAAVDGPRVHAADPGGADTAMTRSMTAAARSPVLRALFATFGPGRRSAATAAHSGLVAATDPRLGVHTGRVVHPGGRVSSPPRRLADPDLRSQVWNRTVALLGLDLDDLPDPATGPRSATGGRS